MAVIALTSDAIKTLSTAQVLEFSVQPTSYYSAGQKEC
jgi:hypothetical protein